MPWRLELAWQVAVGSRRTIRQRKLKDKSPLNTIKGLGTPPVVHGLQVDFHWLPAEPSVSQAHLMFTPRTTLQGINRISFTSDGNVGQEETTTREDN